MGYDAALAFLRAVLPTAPRYIGGTKRDKGGVIHSYHDTVESLAHQQIDADTDGRKGAVYFALAAYGAANNREAANAHTLRSLWLDADVGPDKAATGKGYATVDDALADIDRFIDAGFPDYSFVVSSGRGLHVYWVLDRDAPKDQWQIAADAFQAAWQSQGLKCDPVSADAARILRCVGTHNRKSAVLPVAVREATGEVHPIAALHQAALRLAPIPLAPSASARKGRAAAVDANDDLMANLPRRAAYLSAITKHCKQVREITKSRGATCSEPLWYAAVQLARHLENGTAAAHYMSSGHPGYSPAAVDAKLDQLAAKDIGPATCELFRRQNPSACAGCRWEITSPIQLGEKDPERAKAKIVVQELVVTDGGAEVVERELDAPVEPPPGFMFAQDPEAKDDNAPICTLAKVLDPKGIASWKVIFPGVIFPTRVSRAPGRPLEMEVHSCRNGTKETSKFTLSATAVGDAKETRNALMGRIMIDSANAPHLQRLLNGMGMSIQSLEHTAAAARQFGWQMGDPAQARKFVYGRTRFSAEGVERGIPIDPAAESTADRLCVPAGSLQGAKAGAALFMASGAQMHLAVYLTGLLGVFSEFMGAQNFAVLSLVSRVGGEGKSTNCDAAMSHWFNPILARSTPRDTANALYNTMSTRGTLPVFIDEVTHTKPDIAVELIYTASQGREKARMEQSGAKQRDPLPPWKCPVMTTSNMSVRQLVRATRGDASALDARIVEMHYTRLPLDAAQRVLISKVFYENYGWTGPAVARHVTANYDQYARWADALRLKLTERLTWDGADRFWLNWGVGVLLACQAMNRLGLADYSMQELFDYVAQLILSQRQHKEAEARDHEDILAEFLADHAGRVVVGYKLDGREGAARLATALDPGRVATLVGRSQLDEHVLYLSTTALQGWCTERGYDFRSLLQDCGKAAPSLIARTYVSGKTASGRDVRSPVPLKYSLGRGTPLASAPSRVLALSLDHPALAGHLADATATVNGPGSKVVYAAA